MQGSTEIRQLRATELQSAYDRVRDFTLRLTESISAEDQMVQSMPDASPTKWHLAHTTWFFETFVLSEYLPNYKPRHPEFRLLFNSYYKQVGKHPVRSTRGTFSRPGLADVLEYRAVIDRSMRELLSRDLPASVLDLVELGLNHEQQHQELIITDIKHAFWSQPLQPALLSSPPSRSESQVPELRWNSFEGGVFQVGHAGDAFAFDNELPAHEVLLQPFRLASRLVTNAEFIEFIEDGGYRRPELWLSDGWDTICQQNWQYPLYWEEGSSGWSVFTTAGIRDLVMPEPVCHVSYYEADAFARWSGARLPLEHEWEIAARQEKIAGNFAGTMRLHPEAAATPGLKQMFGDVWEWTSSAYLPYPGYCPAEGAVGEYNGKFMCNQFVLRGGSCATPKSHIRATYRNFFPPHVRWQFMGIRLATNER